MNVIVCIKPIKSTLIYTDNDLERDEMQINPYDLMALLELIELKKSMDLNLICICVGPQKAACVLKQAFAIGADEGYLVSDSSYSGADTLATTYVLSQVIKRIKDVGLIVCGLQSVDGETGQVPAGIAERLGIAHIVYGSEIKSIDEETITYYSQRGDENCLFRSKLPVVFKCETFQVKMPHLSLIQKKRSLRKRINYLTNSELNIQLDKCGSKGSKTIVEEVKSKYSKSKSCVKIKKSPNEIADFLIEILNKD